MKCLIHAISFAVHTGCRTDELNNFNNHNSQAVTSDLTFPSSWMIINRINFGFALCTLC